MASSRSRGLIVRGLIAAALATCISLVRPAPRPHSRRMHRPGRAANKISIQLGRSRSTSVRHRPGDDRAHGGSVPAAERDGLPQRRAVHAQRPERQAVPALLDRYGLKASARHVNVGTPTSPVDFSQILAENQVLGIRFFGSGGTPHDATEAEWIAYAPYLDQPWRAGPTGGADADGAQPQLGVPARLRRPDGVDILMEHTEPKNVVFQLDIYWATNGGGVANPVAVLERYGNRIQLFHVKDMAAGPFPGRSRSSARASSTSRRSLRLPRDR